MKGLSGKGGKHPILKGEEGGSSPVRCIAEMVAIHSADEKFCSASRRQVLVLLMNSHVN